MPLLNVGDNAPDFQLQDHTGKTRTLGEFKGKRVLLWFYPKADTPGCTKEGCGFRDRARDYSKLNVQILGASFDNPKDNAAFVKKYDFTYPLLCDVNRTLGLAYGATTDPKATYPERISYLIGGDGKIEKVWDKVDAKAHPASVLAELGGASAPM
ncbi:MAG: peroxiredoxin [Planctomycetota bacterium]